MTYSYTAKRSKQRYAGNRVPVPDIPSFKIISKLLFASSMLLTLVGFWVDSVLLVQIYHHSAVQLTGTLLVLVGFINLQLAFRHLGGQYSPSFDAYLPSDIVMTGHYRFVRHPVYLFNLFVSFGLAIAAGSLLVWLNAVIGLLFILKIIKMEESCLKEHFPEYGIYQKNTWRLLPFY